MSSVVQLLILLFPENEAMVIANVSIVYPTRS